TELTNAGSECTHEEADRMPDKYSELHTLSLHDPETFWSNAAQSIHWHKKWTKVLDDSRAPLYRWFVGGEVNTCYNALDRHVDSGRAEQIALIYDSPVTSTIQTFTYRELRDQVPKFAGALASLGVRKGDRVIIY